MRGKKVRSLQERLTELGEYHPSFSSVDGKWLVKVCYPEGWVTIKPEGDEVNVEQDKNYEDMFYYYSPQATNIDRIFDYIEENIRYNKEQEEKASLLTKKIDELQKLFLDESLDNLKTLEFRFKRRRGAQKNNRNAAKKQDTAETATKGPKDEIVKVKPKEISGACKQVQEGPKMEAELSEEELAKRFGN